MRSMIGAVLMLISVAVSSAEATRFDQSHTTWGALLSRHVQWNVEGTASTVDYAEFSHDSEKLEVYLDTLSKVERTTFDAWNQNDRQAFLINTYNAATVKLILSGYPELESIKGLGGIFSSPWKKEFVDLLGERRSLDSIEHDLLRGARDYRDPRIHFAVNCASIGCPALRPEAYTGEHLQAQLEDQTNRFLKDRNRNRLTTDRASLRVSKVFDWYSSDFAAHSGGVSRFLAEHANALGLDAAHSSQLREGKLPIRFTDYDWSLNERAH